MIAVDPAWWKTLFDEVSLVTDAPFVCHPALIKSEVDMVEWVLPLRPTLRIRDCCGGQGRHALELARRGYRPPIVLDYSTVLLQRGRQATVVAGLDVPFCQGDARALAFASASFDVGLLLTNSFGYGVEVADDRRVGSGSGTGPDPGRALYPRSHRSEGRASPLPHRILA